MIESRVNNKKGIMKAIRRVFKFFNANKAKNEAESERNKIVKTIEETEKKYLDSLQTIINHYKKPLEQDKKILTSKKIETLFYGFDEILRLHRDFNFELSKCISEWDEQELIGGAFLTTFSKPNVLDVYSKFINNYPDALKVYQRSLKSSEFKRFLADRKSLSKDNLDLPGMMIKPVQRLPQFIMVLNDLNKSTPNEHYDKRNIEAALKQLECLANQLNDRKKICEEKQKNLKRSSFRRLFKRRSA